MKITLGKDAPIVPMDHYALMPFGKYKGLPLASVPADYLLWLLSQPFVSTSYPALHLYLLRNQGVLSRLVEEDDWEEITDNWEEIT